MPFSTNLAVHALIAEISPWTRVTRQRPFSSSENVEQLTGRVAGPEVGTFADDLIGRVVDDDGAVGRKWASIFISAVWGMYLSKANLRAALSI
ncbi:hypothetical protein SCAR479_06859 [Seiridium cardinale]|uniref:Uncharacterized protein n=1 Tax=Seiridium cardinale TaxID=138064 RepID=A0ABR2XRW0_9PEZI